MFPIKKFLKFKKYSIPGAILAAGVLFYIFIAYLLPLPDNFFDKQFTETTKIYDRNGVLLYEILNPEEGKKTYIPLNKIPQNVIYATLAAEDIDFYSHGALDLKAIARAVYLNLKAGEIVSGGSTITQQLTRNLLGTENKRTVFNKAKEAIYAISLSKKYSKNEILEMYLNKVYYGNLTYGIASAAKDYFGKNIYDLDTAEIALLTAIPKAPAALNPFYNYKNAKTRQELILNLMKKHEFLSEEEFNLSMEEKLNFRKNRFEIKAPHFVYFVLNKLEEEYGKDAVHYGGMKVYTTLDYNLQKKAETHLELQVSRLKKNNAGNGAILSLDINTNEILVWTGSRDYFNEEIDGAVDMITSLRQPGSSIKPFNYLAAFLKGYTPATTVTDIFTQFDTETGPYTPKNYDLTFHGTVRLRTALASSFNVPAVKVLDYVGVADFIGFLKKFGIESLNEGPSHYGLSLTLGGGEIRPLELAGAYATLARYGVKKDLKWILKIERSRNQESKFMESGKQNDFNEVRNINQGEESVQILGQNGEQAAYQIIDILSDKNARLPGFGSGNILETSFPSAVKTGTTRNFRDNWTVGFTPDYLTLVWIGNADSSPMQNVSGVSGAAPLWHAFMSELMRNKPVKNFEKPERIREIEICEISGKLPTEFCRDRIFEKFIEGTEPREYDDMWRKYLIKKVDGYECVCKEIKSLKTETHGNFNDEKNCEGAEEKIYLSFPPELRRWAMEYGVEEAPAACFAEISPAPSPSTSSGQSTIKEADPISAALIEVISPQEGDSFMIDPEIPLQFQKIPLRVTASNEIKSVKWFVDGNFAEEVFEFPFTYLWEISKGRHEVYAVGVGEGGEIKTVEVKFKVN